MGNSIVHQSLFKLPSTLLLFSVYFAHAAKPKCKFASKNPIITNIETVSTNIGHQFQRVFPNATNMEKNDENYIFKEENNENYVYEEEPPQKVLKYNSVQDLLMDQDAQSRFCNVSGEFQIRIGSSCCKKP